MIIQPPPIVAPLVEGDLKTVVTSSVWRIWFQNLISANDANIESVNNKIPQAATTVTDEAYGNAAVVGTLTTYSREDHRHAMPASTKDKTAATGILKGDGTDVTAATANTDYLPVDAPSATGPFTMVGTAQIGDNAGNNTEIESDGTLKFNGDATVWDDIQFQISTGKVPAANFPTWEAFTTNTSEYSFTVDDHIALGANEMAHWWKEGTAAHVHMHVANKTANTSGADRFAKFTVYFAYAGIDTVWTETSVTAELTIPDTTAALNHFKLDLGSVDMTGLTIGTQVKIAVKRIAATGGTEYADNTFITQIGIHAEADTVGSRQITTK